MKKILRLLLRFVLWGMLGAFLLYCWLFFPIMSGYVAKATCSEVFLAGRSPEKAGVGYKVAGPRRGLAAGCALPEDWVKWTVSQYVIVVPSKKLVVVRLSLEKGYLDPGNFAADVAAALK